jgi:FkbM family methyltransferase
MFNLAFKQLLASRVNEKFRRADSRPSRREVRDLLDNKDKFSLRQQFSPAMPQYLSARMLLQRLNELGIWQRKVKVFGHCFRPSTLDRLVSLWLHKVGILGREESGILRRLVNDEMTVVDLGANQGLYTLFLADLARRGKIFAFEPHPILYGQLVANVRQNRIENVNCYQTAVSSSSGSITLQLGRLNLGDNYIVTPGAGIVDTVQVKAVTLDELFAAIPIDFLKIDIQGWEADALAGGRQVLQRNQGILVLFEFWPFGLRRAGANPNRLLSYLTELGFSIYCLRRNRLVSLQETSLPDPAKEFAYRNLLAMRDPARFDRVFQ